MDIQARKQKVLQTIQESVGDLLQSRIKSEGRLRFTDSDSEYGAGGNVGPIATLQGLRSVFGALVALLEESTDLWTRVVKPHFQSLIDDWKIARDEIARDGYDANPLVGHGDLKKILCEDAAEPQAYTDAVSWILSTTVLMNFACKRLAKTPGLQFEFESTLGEDFRQTILKELKHLLALQRLDGGWGWSEGANKGHLYFTWAALGGLSDYYDYVAGDSPELGIEADQELLAYLEREEPGIVERVSEKWMLCLEFLKPLLKSALDGRLQDADIFKDPRFTYLGERPCDKAYFELYLLEALVLQAYDKPGGKLSPANLDQLRRLYQNTLVTFREMSTLAATSPGGENAKDLTFLFNLRSKNKVRMSYVQYLVQDPGLWPQYLRAWNMYRFYSDPTQEPETVIVSEDGSALQLLLEDRRPRNTQNGPGLWDKIEYNLPLTARSIEALVDANDYLNLFVRREESEVLREEPEALATQITDAIHRLMADRLSADERFLGRVRAGTASSGQDSEQKAPVTTAVPVQPDRPSIEEPEQFGKRLNLALSHAAQYLQPGGVGAETEELLRMILSPQQDVDDLRESNEPAYNLLCHLVRLNVIMTARLLPVVLREAILAQEKDAEKTVQYLDKDREQAGRQLHKRITVALLQLCKAEFDGLSKGPDEQISYVNMTEALLEKGRPVPAKGKKG